MIQNQVKLPLAIALDVTLQGIRIRFGRSLVTVMGVMFGIAFLMSILTGIIVREGVKEEEDRRVVLGQMYSFLVAEIGSPKERVIGIIQRGALNELETRFIQMLVKGNVSGFRWYSAAGSPSGLPDALVTRVDETTVGEGASVVLMAGAADESPSFRWSDSFLSEARQKVLALTRNEYGISAAGDGSVIALRAELSGELKKKALQERQTNRFRNAWIIVISLLVTVIGISNSMLMSVTERFREIGTMKCLGALSAFVRQMFFFEAIIMGFAGSLAGALAGCLFALTAYGFIYEFGMVFSSVKYPVLLLYLLCSLAAGTAMSVVAAIYPAQFASRMVPATALRSNV
jgi:hypothetical protein